MKTVVKKYKEISPFVISEYSEDNYQKIIVNVPIIIDNSKIYEDIKND